jgi:predicted AAA+ superfamily ATPase
MINETFRLSSYAQRDFEFSYFRTERGAEVDLVIETPRGKRIAVEFKSSANPVPSDCRAGFRAIRELDSNIQTLCVCNAPHRRRLEDLEFLPWRDYFEWLAAE